MTGNEAREGVATSTSESESKPSKHGILSLACCAAFYGSFILSSNGIDPLGEAVRYSSVVGGIGLGLLALKSAGDRNLFWATISLSLFSIVIVPYLLLWALSRLLNGHGITPFM